MSTTIERVKENTVTLGEDVVPLKHLCLVPSSLLLAHLFSFFSSIRGPVRPKIYELFGSDPEFHLVQGYISDADYMRWAPMLPWR